MRRHHCSQRQQWLGWIVFAGY